MEAPITSTHASRTGAIDMSMEGGGNLPPQTPATGSGKIPSLDLSKVPNQQMPGTTTNKSSGRKLLLQSPTAQNARNTMAERIAGNLGKEKQDQTNKRELPNHEFQDFLSVYDDTMWQKIEEEKKAPEPKNTLDTTITDEIKEEDQEGSEASEDEEVKQKVNDDSPRSEINSVIDNTSIGEGDEEGNFMSLDEALESEFDINKVSKLNQRLKDVNRQPRKRNELYPFRL